MEYGTLGKRALHLATILVAASCVASTSAVAQTTFGTGVFEGIIQSGSNNDEGFGIMVLALTRTGTFSMRFNVGVNSVGHHYYVKVGKFDQNGHYHIEGPAPTDTRYEIPVNMDLQLDSIDNPTRITGSLNDFTHSSSITVEKIFVATRGNPAPPAGVYTFLFDATQQPDPPGTGWGRAIVTSTGVVVASGRTPDGRAFAQAANLTVYNNWPVFIKMAGTVYGIFSGWLNFQDQSSSDFSGQLTWIGPEEPGPNHAFVPQFVTTVNVSGSRYSFPRGSMLLQVNSSTNNVHLNISDGGLENQIDRDITLTTANRFTFAPRQVGDALVGYAGWGLFVGTFKHTDGRIYAYRGAFHQKQNRGGGQFVSHDGESGGVSLTAN
jgi:hypothetical protein